MPDEFGFYTDFEYARTLAREQMHGKGVAGSVADRPLDELRDIGTYNQIYNALYSLHERLAKREADGEMVL
jgi:hypothetical protein